MHIVLNRILPFIAFAISVQYATSQPGLFDHYTRKDGLPSNQIYGLLQGNEGNIWMATASSVCSYNGFSFNSYALEGLQKDEICTGLVSDRAGNFWCYTSGGRLYKFSENHFAKVPFEDKLSNQLSKHIINGLYISNSGEIWISTVIGGGLYHLNEISDVTAPQDMEGISFYVKKIEENGFICGSAHTVETKNRLRIMTGDRHYDITLSANSGFSRSNIIQLQDNTYLFSKDYELINFDDDRLRTRVFMEKNIETIFQDSEGKLWIGLYQGGVICYPDGHFKSSAHNAYLGGKTISAICEDFTGNIWFASIGDGVYFLPSSETLTYNPPKVYSSTNEKRISDVHHAVVSSAQPGLSNAVDFRVISTDTARYDTIPPSIYISGIKIMGVDTSVKSFYELPYDQNYISISYAGFSFSHPEALQYKYILEGLNNKVMYTNQSSVQFATLPPGAYRFKVSAMNKNGYWSEIPATIDLLIRPPFWKTWWFRISSSLMAILTISVLMYIWIRDIKKKERKKATIKKQMAELELQALKAQMNPHFIFNTMSSIQHLITSDRKADALRYLSRLAMLMRMIMENSSKPRVILKDELSALEHYLQLESLRFKNKFSYEIRIDDTVDLQYDTIPAMIIQPYAENAILHGFANLNKEGKLLISLKKKEDCLYCIVQDNGIGRKCAADIKRSSKIPRESKGMSITANRLELLNALNGNMLSVHVRDVTDDRGNCMGTKVEIIIPFEKETS